MGLLVSIDNGGTLTDVCATDGSATHHVKTITTPHDLTECFLAGLEALSERIFGEPDLPRLIAEIDHIRYSTTQGTNAIVQRKGPRIGLLTDSEPATRLAREAVPELWDCFVSDRVRTCLADPTCIDGQRELVAAVSELVSAGSNRIVVALTGPQAAGREREMKRALHRCFPRHLLGAVPLLFATELSPIGTAERRVWAALINSFLHPAMEQFLYNAENRLRDMRARKPLLIFGNDGTSTRVAKTTAIKTYSSGPQGGVVGTQVLLRHYGIASALSMDIGGTTTDLARFENGEVQIDLAGRIEGAPVPISLARIHSLGVGGSSIVRVVDGALAVGPESVGSAPGPACFARGGTSATITDALLIDGILDARSFFGGRLPLDPERASRAVMAQIGEPLGLSLEQSVVSMTDAYDEKLAAAAAAGRLNGGSDVLVAFGGAGPMSACGIAQKAGFDCVLIPRFAAVFSAFGIGFSDIRHVHLAQLRGAGSIDAAKATLLEQARRGMMIEGLDLADCVQEWALLDVSAEGFAREPLPDASRDPGDGRWLELRVTRPIVKIALGGNGCVERHRVPPLATRPGRECLPVHAFEALRPGDWGSGPCLVEEAYFTTRVLPQWRFMISDNGDLFLRR